MSSVCGKLDFKGADFEISVSNPTRCTDGSKLCSHAGSDESQESDGDETGYINQTGDDELALESLSLKSSDDEENDENLTTTVSRSLWFWICSLFVCMAIIICMS